jgi:choline-sulfatase
MNEVRENAGRRGPWVVIAMVALAAAAIWGGCALRARTGPGPIVLVTIDTLRADRLGAYGRSPTITPKLDALAACGVVFENAWTTAPLTVPAHATLLTGLLPPKHGLRVNKPPTKVPALAARRYVTLAETLKEKGYATAAVVSASVLRDDVTGFAAGFDVYREVPPAAAGSLHDSEWPGRGAEAVEHALAWARTAPRRSFLWVHLFDPHAPYDAPTGWGAGPDHTGDATGYDAEVAYTDDCVGRLLDGLAQAGMDDAVVAIVSDHGEGLGEHGEASHGYLMHEATLRVPLIVAAPGLPAGRRAGPVSVVDVFPTLLALAGHPIPPHVNGAPLFDRAGTDTLARPIYAETLYPWHACRWAQQFALRRGDAKLVLSGPRRMAFDLAEDASEERPAEFDATQTGEAAQLMEVASSTPLGAESPGDPAAPLPSYFGGATAGPIPVLPEAENAKLPSPYDRMDLLRRFDAACALVGAGRAAEAVESLREILREDPGNLQCGYWIGRALERSGRPAEAAAAFRDAFDAGFTASACVVKALQCSLQALHGERQPPGATGEWDRAVAFLAKARGKGLRDDAPTCLFEALLYLQDGHIDRARADDALRRAASAPGADADIVQTGIRQARELYEALPK